MGWKAAGGPQGKPPLGGGFGGRRPPGSASGRTALRAGSSLLRKFWSRESAGFPARQGAGEGRCRGQAKRGRPAAPRKSKAKWRACSLLGLGLLQGEGRPHGAWAPPQPAALPPPPAGGPPARRGLGPRRRRRLARGGGRGAGGPCGPPGRAEIQRKYRVTSAPGPADGRRLHGFAAPVRGKCGCGGWPQQNPPGVRQIQAHPRRQSAPARPR